MLRKIPTALNVPPMLVQPGVEKLNSQTTIPPSSAFPVPAFSRYRLDSQKRRMPQCIAHRGYKAKFPENTMASFKGAVEAGTHALETDVHVTKDEVVILSHDPSLKRCYGVDKKIKDCTWNEVKEMRTIDRSEPMPRLEDLLQYLAQPGLENIWLLLDIKLGNDADQIMRLLGSTIASSRTSSSDSGKAKPWSERIVLGVWAAKYLPLALKYSPGFPVSHIGFSVSYARHFFTVPNVSFNMMLPMLIAPGGKSFIRDARKEGRLLYTWTVNEKDKMEWTIRRQLDGVCTDDVPKFLDVCAKFDERARESWFPISLRGYVDVWRVWVWVLLATFWFRKWFRTMFLPVASQELIRKAGNDAK